MRLILLRKMEKLSTNSKDTKQRGKQQNKLRLAKGWFCTWPKCPVSKEDALTILQTNGLPKIVEYVICEEKHEDGSPHLHAFIKLAKRQTFNQVNKKLDLLEYHGHYETAKSWNSVKDYVKKDGNYISNLNLDAAQRKQAKNLMPEDFERDPIELMEEGKLHPMSLNNFLRNRSTYLGLKRSKGYDGKKKCYWIVGKPRIGKSYTIRKTFPDLYVKPQNKWWDGYAGEENVLLDDLDSAMLGHYLKIWGDQYPFTAEIKNGTVQPVYKRFFITSNYSIDQLFEKDEILREAIYGRFKVINADEIKNELGYFDWELVD